MEDVLALAEKPYDPTEPVMCLDEKPIPLHAEVRAPIPAKPGKPAKQDNEYERCGTANVFGVVEPKAGRHFTMATPDRSGAQFARMLGRIVERYPFAKTIHLVVDNLNSHTKNSLLNYYGEREGSYLWDRFTVHYTPKHGSWLNQAEIELSLYSRQCLGKRRFPDLYTLCRETQAWNRTANRKRTKINWRFTRRKARKLFGTRASDRNSRLHKQPTRKPTSGKLCLKTLPKDGKSRCPTISRSKLLSIRRRNAG